MHVQQNAKKNKEFYSQNKFEKLVHLVGFIIRIYHDAPSPERQIGCNLSDSLFLQNINSVLWEYKAVWTAELLCEHWIKDKSIISTDVELLFLGRPECRVVTVLSNCD